MARPPDLNEQSRRVVGILSAAALAVVVVGFFTGIQPVSVAPAFLPPPEEPGGTKSAPSYQELRKEGFDSSASLYTAGLLLLERALPKVTDPVVQTAEQRIAALERRAEGRAFDGAPPTVPHAIDTRAEPNCLACHERGLILAGRIAPRMSHRRLDSCTQCHVPRGTSSEEANYWAENTFVGLPLGGKGERAYEGAPPTMPHPTSMREDCASCHGVAGPFGLKSTHPERQSCPQCHAPSAERDQRPFFPGASL